MTGENKKRFEDWLKIWIKKNVAWISEEVKKEDIDMFYKYPTEMQEGVIITYYISVNYDIEVLRYSVYNTLNGCYFEWVIHIDNENIIEYNKEYDSRPEALKAAFEKANELVNESLNK